MIRHLVVGYGEVGRALFDVLKAGHPDHGVDAVDLGLGVPPKVFSAYEGLHICTPVSDCPDLARTIEAASTQAATDAIVVLHSTVPVGTTRYLAARLGIPLVYSPVRGAHPNLREGLCTFPKYVGGRHADTVATWFIECGMTVRVFPDPETPEAMKLWDTAQYGWQIVLAKEIAEWCHEHGLDFADVYQRPNQEYNSGYAAMGRPEVVRPYLRDMPGPIGGHCIVPNLALLGPTFIGNVVAAANINYKEKAASEAPQVSVGRQ